MFDPKYVDQPWKFNPKRPIGTIYTLAICIMYVREYIVMSVIPAVLQSLLSEYHLIRIPGPVDINEKWHHGCRL